MRHPFEHTDDGTKVFYSKVFYMAVLNLNAVQMGLYPKLLCDMDGPLEVGMWKAALPQVLAKMRLMGGHRGR